jgi:hypothetical protein
MADKRIELYRSANGDAWLLVREASGAVYVEHEPNEPSGGQSSRLSLGAFLARGSSGPEHQALNHLISMLVDEAPVENAPAKTAVTNEK